MICVLPISMVADGRTLDRYLLSAIVPTIWWYVYEIVLSILSLYIIFKYSMHVRCHLGH
jgi:hypothetical protein